MWKEGQLGFRACLRSKCLKELKESFLLLLSSQNFRVLYLETMCLKSPLNMWASALF